MEGMFLLQTQKNDVTKEIQELGLTHLEFEWGIVRSTLMSDVRVSKLMVRGSKFYFIFDFSRGEHYAEFSPSFDLPVEKKSTKTWDNQLRCVHNWLNCLKRETEAPDLWSTILQERKLIEAVSAPEINNTPFTDQELKSIPECLNRIEQYLVNTYNLTPEHTEFVRLRFKYLEEAAGRSKWRIDWLNIAINVLLNIAIKLGLDQVAWHNLLGFVADNLRTLFSELHLLQ